MPESSQIDDLISQWERLQQQGQRPSAEDLCRDCPELLQEVRRAIQALERFQPPLSPTTLVEPHSQDSAGAAPRTVAPPATLGRYRLETLLGEGGFGQVWRAHDPELQRPVAIKVPRPDRVGSQLQIDKFLLEARKAARLRHPAILPVYDVGREGDWCFIVCELIDGGDLARRIGDNRSNLVEAARVVAAVADALHFAHLSGLVHRDVKPANILLDQNGNPFLTDFGLATTEEEQRAEGGGILGTFPYMSPEQIRGDSDQVDGRTDIYSLGIVLYELLTGRRPFQGASWADWEEQILHREPRPPRSIVDTIPKELERICLQCLAKPVSQRYTTASDVAADLRQWLVQREKSHEADATGRQRTPADPMREALKPVAFDAELARLQKDFVGREWLDAELERWLQLRDSRIFFLTGDPGTGKSAYLAHVVDKFPQVAAYHFCVASLVESLNPLRFAQSLAAQLAERRADYRNALGGVHGEKAAETDAGMLLRRLVADPLRALTTDQTALIVIDALDEALLASGERSLARLLQERIDDLPAWVRFVISARKEPEIFDLFRHVRWHEIEVTRPENLRDVAQYLQRKFQDPAWADLLRRAGAHVETTASLIRQKSEGNFLYVIQVLEAIQVGQINPRRPETFPEGLVGIYRSFFERVFPQRQGYETFRPLLDVLTAAREPLSAEQLADFLGRDAFDVENDVQKLAAFFPERDGRYRACHKSLNDWLCGRAGHARTYRVNLKAGNRLLADKLLAVFRTGRRDAFTLAHLPTHLLEAERWDDLESLLTDLAFIEAKCKARMTFALVADYNAALAAWPGRAKDELFGPLPEPPAEWLRACTAAIIAPRTTAPVDEESNIAGPRDSEAAVEYPHPDKGSGPMLSALRGSGIRTAAGRQSPRYRTGELLPASLIPNAASFSSLRARLRQGEFEEVTALPQRVETPAQRVQVFANFVALHSHILERRPWNTTLVAYNQAAEGLVAEQAAIRVMRWNELWVARDPRPPAPSLRPACFRLLRGHTETLLGLALSGDGKLVVSASEDQTLRVWDVPSGECLGVLTGHTGGVTGVATTPDGRLAISSSLDGTLRVWDVGSRECLKILKGHTDDVLGVAMTPDAALAVSASRDGTLRVWNLSTGKCRRVLQGYGGQRRGSIDVELSEEGTNIVLRGRTGKVKALAVTPEGRLALIAGSDDALRVWDLATGLCLRVLQGHSLPVSGAVLSADGRLALSGSNDQTLRLWDVATGDCLRVMKAYAHIIEGVEMTFDGVAISGGRDGALHTWDLQTGEILRVFSTSPIHAVAVTPDGRIAATANADLTICVWDLGGSASEQATQGHLDVVLRFVWFDEGRKAISASRDGTLRVWDREEDTWRFVLEGHTSWVRGLAVTADGTKAVSGSWDASLRLWDLATGSCLRAFGSSSEQRAHDSMGLLNGHLFAVCDVAITPDGKRAISAGYDRTLRLWDLENGACLRVLSEQRSAVMSVAMSADGQLGVSGSWDGSIWVWDLETGACLWTLSGHQSWVNRIALTPTGRNAISASNDGTLMVWDVRSGKCIRVLYGHTGAVHDVSLTNNGLIALSAGADQTVRVWAVALETCLAVYHAGAEACSVSQLRADNRFSCGTVNGQMHDLVLMNRPQERLQ